MTDHTRRIRRHGLASWRALWWLDSRQDSERNVSGRVEKDEAGCFYQRQANSELRELARRNRRKGEVDLRSRCEVGCRHRPVLVYSIARIGFIISFKGGFS
jgi:hypothetical protein